MNFLKQEARQKKELVVTRTSDAVKLIGMCQMTSLWYTFRVESKTDLLLWLPIGSFVCWGGGGFGRGNLSCKSWGASQGLAGGFMYSSYNCLFNLRGNSISTFNPFGYVRNGRTWMGIFFNSSWVNFNRCFWQQRSSRQILNHSKLRNQRWAVKIILGGEDFATMWQNCFSWCRWDQWKRISERCKSISFVTAGQCPCSWQ